LSLAECKTYNMVIGQQKYSTVIFERYKRWQAQQI
jgi:hypothetical protein